MEVDSPHPAAAGLWLKIGIDKSIFLHLENVARKKLEGLSKIGRRTYPVPQWFPNNDAYLGATSSA
jgi:hypothetical protein